MTTLTPRISATASEGRATVVEEYVHEHEGCALDGVVSATMTVGPMTRGDAEHALECYGDGTLRQAYRAAIDALDADLPRGAIVVGPALPDDGSPVGFV